MPADLRTGSEKYMRLGATDAPRLMQCGGKEGPIYGERPPGQRLLKEVTKSLCRGESWSHHWFSLSPQTIVQASSQSQPRRGMRVCSITRGDAPASSLTQFQRSSHLEKGGGGGDKEPELIVPVLPEAHLYSAPPNSLSFQSKTESLNSSGSWDKQSFDRKYS